MKPKLVNDCRIISHLTISVKPERERERVDGILCFCCVPERIKCRLLLGMHGAFCLADIFLCGLCTFICEFRGDILKKITCFVCACVSSNVFNCCFKLIKISIFLFGEKFLTGKSMLYCEELLCLMKISTCQICFHC